MHRWDVFLGRVRYECVEVWGRCVEAWERCVEVCERELSAQVGCISREGEI